jgi:hypothetical protein
MTTKMALLKVLPEVIREAAKPMEAIDSIKIVQVDGLTGNGGAAGTANGGGDGERNLANSAVAAALRYRAQAPVIDGLMKELGFDGSSFEALVKSATEDGAAGAGGRAGDRSGSGRARGAARQARPGRRIAETDRRAVGTARRAAWGRGNAGFHPVGDAGRVGRGVAGLGPRLGAVGTARHCQGRRHPAQADLAEFDRFLDYAGVSHRPADPHRR